VLARIADAYDREIALSDCDLDLGWRMLARALDVPFLIHAEMEKRA
jgi:hypothetical protein